MADADFSAKATCCRSSSSSSTMNTQIVFVSLLLASSLPVVAWDGPGHMIVAKIAYDNVNPNARAKLNELAPGIVLQGHALNPINVATWPDEIKHANPKTEPFATFYGNWHFIDMGLSTGDPDLISNPPPLTQRDGTLVEALKQCEQVLRTHQKSEWIPNESVALALLIHLVGDLHQPLHCATNYYTPKPKKHPTDAGGNAVNISNFTNKYPELHQFWDTGYKIHFDSSAATFVADPDWDLFSIDPQSKELNDMVTQILADKPSTPVTFDGDHCYADWARESHQIAKDTAYGKLGAAALAPNANIAVDANYANAVETVTRQRLCLAGLRLAAILNDIYPPQAPASEPQRP